MLLRTIIMGLLWMILGLLSMQGSCVSKPSPPPKRLIPRLVHVITNNGSAAPSLAAESTSGSASSSPHPEVSSAHFDLQHQYVELQVENERLKAENDLLRTEIATLRAPKPVVYQQPATYRTTYGQQQVSGCANGQCGRVGLFGWRR